MMEKKKKEVDLVLEKKRTERRRDELLRSREMDLMMLRRSFADQSEKEDQTPRPSGLGKRQTSLAVLPIPSKKPSDKPRTNSDSPGTKSATSPPLLLSPRGDNQVESAPLSTPFWLCTTDLQQITDWLFDEYTGQAFTDVSSPPSQPQIQRQVIETVQNLFEPTTKDECKERDTSERKLPSIATPKENYPAPLSPRSPRPTEPPTITVLGQYKLLVKTAPKSPTFGSDTDIYDVEALLSRCFPTQNERGYIKEETEGKEKEKETEPEEEEKEQEKEKEKEKQEQEHEQEQGGREGPKSPTAEGRITEEREDSKAKVPTEDTEAAASPKAVAPARKVPFLAASRALAQEVTATRRRGMTSGHIAPVPKSTLVDDIFQDFKPTVRRTRSDGFMHSWEYSLNASHTTPRHPYKGSSSPNELFMLPMRTMTTTLLDRALGEGGRRSSSSASSHSSFSEAESESTTSGAGDDSDAPGRGFFGEDEPEDEMHTVDVIQTPRAQLPPMELMGDVQGQILFSSSKEILKATVDALFWVLISKDVQGTGLNIAT